MTRNVQDVLGVGEKLDRKISLSSLDSCFLVVLLLLYEKTNADVRSGFKYIYHFSNHLPDSVLFTDIE